MGSEYILGYTAFVTVKHARPAGLVSHKRGVEETPLWAERICVTGSPAVRGPCTLYFEVL